MSCSGGVVAGGGQSPQFYLLENWKNFLAKLQNTGLEIQFWRNLGAKLKFWAFISLLSEICSCLPENCNVLPTPF